MSRQRRDGLHCDGVTTVVERGTSAQAASAGAPSYYTIEYLTESTRGEKVYCCKYSITGRKLYVLQVQAKRAAFDGDAALRADLRGIVESFTIAAAPAEGA